MVPKGGVKKGEIFSSHVIDEKKDDTDTKLTSQHVGMAMIKENNRKQQNPETSTSISMDRKYERIQVVAPDNLQEGNEFEFELKDKIYLVTVPKGGVKKGGLFFADIHCAIDERKDYTDGKFTLPHVGTARIKENNRNQLDADSCVSIDRKRKRIQVVAPNDLPEGKKFEVELKDKTYLVTVPKGGVKKGEVFFSEKEMVDQDERSEIHSIKEKQKYLAVAKPKQNKTSSPNDELEVKKNTNAPTVNVVAPETLPEGYKFEAELNGETFQVQVPKGGVRKGQVFSSLMFHEDECSKKSISSRRTKSTQSTAVAVKKGDSDIEIISDKSSIKSDFVQMVSVVAPEDLPEGYKFDAELNGQTFQVTVPAGGVRKGDIFKSIHKTKELCCESLQRNQMAQSVNGNTVMKENKESIEISVIAPSNLPEGYIFDVELNGTSASVIVPKGGVRQGEIFISPILEKNQVNSNDESTLGSSQKSVPLTLNNSSISSMSNLKDSVLTTKVDLHAVNVKEETLNELKNTSTLSNRSKSSIKRSSDKKKIVKEPLTNSSHHTLKENSYHPKSIISSFESSHEDGNSTKTGDDSTKEKSFSSKAKWNENIPNDVVTIQDSLSRKNNKSNLSEKKSGDRGRLSPLLKRDKFKVNIPVGFWKDQLFCCVADGVTHSVVFSSIFCPHIALAQIRNRMKMIEKGEGPGLRQPINIKALFMITFFYIFLHCITIYYVLREGTDVAIFYLLCVPLFSFDVLGILIFYVMVVQTRQNIRSTFEIPHHECQCCTDTVSAVGCTCCTITQMARHTGDYLTYRGYCCTDTGLPDHIDLSFD